ncbi:MAG: hypothetical protein SFV21_21360 [Rhodospirillaceae bacterium]|nr:hypothetical protein [Rhodospirillaceae bacterium]
MKFALSAAAIALTAALSLPAAAAEQGAAGKPAAAGKEGRERTLGRYSGWEGRERELGLILNMVYKTLEDNEGYQHEINDALVKHHLTAMQFAKDQNLVKEAVAHEVETETPMLKRVAKMIEKSGDKELALKAIFDQTTCHWQLVLDTEMAPGMRRYRSPFGHVLAVSTPLGQHDIDEKWIHENWTMPRFQAYAQILGVELDISPWQADGMITVKLKNYTPPATAAKTSAVTN